MLVVARLCKQRLVSERFDGKVSAKHTVVTEEELVIVRIFFVRFVFDVHVVVVYGVLYVHEGLLSKFRSLCVQDFLENSALVGVVRVEDGVYRNSVVERVDPIDDVKAIEHVVAQVGVEVNLGVLTGRDYTDANPLVINENSVEVLNPFLEIYTVHREELGAVYG